MRRCDGVRVPDHYRAPLRRPNGPDPLDGGAALLWDLTEHWPTTAEWLAWCRRGGRTRVWDGARWRWPSRPIITASRTPWSNRRMRRLP